MATIIVVGSIAQDDIVELVEPLRRGAHVEGHGTGIRLGGGGPNTAVPLAAAGHRVAVLAAVGDDAAGAGLTAELAAGGVDTSLVRTLESGATTRSIVMLEAEGERTIVNLQRAAEDAPPARLLEAPADWVYVRSRALDLADLMRAKAASARIVAHIPPVVAGSRPAHVLVGSESDLDADVLADPFAAGRRIAGSLLEWVVITRGPRGATAFDADGGIERSAPRVEPVDTTGAGDSFVAGLLHALASGSAMEAALETGIAWGAESVKWQGSRLPAGAVAGLVSG